MSQARFALFLDTFDLDPNRHRAQSEQVNRLLLETDPIYHAQLKPVCPGVRGPVAGALTALLTLWPRHDHEISLR